MYTSYVHYFHHKSVLSIGCVEKVPNLIQKMTMQRITEVNWKEHEKCHFWRRLPCIFSVFSKTMEDGGSEAILQFKCLSKDQTLITRTNYAIICFVLGVRSLQKIVVLYRRPFFGGKWCILRQKLLKMYKKISFLWIFSVETLCMYVFLNITTKSDKRSGFPRKYLYKTWVKREFPFVYGLCRT